MPTIASHRIHGTRGQYVEGCRCEDCRQANAAYYRRRRAIKPAVRKPGEGRERRAKRLETVRQLKGTTCADCHDQFSPDNLGFHHIDKATKSFTIGKWHKGIAGHSTLAALHAEVAKCVTLCLPCHMDRHRAMRARGS